MMMWCGGGWMRAVRGARHASSGSGGESPLRRLVRAAATGREGLTDEPELQWATQPYAAPARPAAPPRRDHPHSAGTVLLFPGQGSQWVGMGRAAGDHPAARAVYDIASHVLGWDVLGVCSGGPAPELERRAQVCVLATSLAALERARAERPAAVEAACGAAGYSAGELAALVWAGCMGVEDALRLAELRAAVMAAAASQRPQGMLTVWLAPAAPLGEAMARARQAAEVAGVAGAVCQTAIYLYAGCRVVAGDEAALQWLEREGAAYGVRRAARVAVAGAYHSALMESTRAPVAAAVRALRLHAPRAAVWSCTRARRYTSAREVARGLARLAVAPVRWEQTLHALFARPAPLDPPPALALGPAKGIAHSLRRVNARAADACQIIDL